MQKRVVTSGKLNRQQKQQRKNTSSAYLYTALIMLVVAVTVMLVISSQKSLELRSSAHKAQFDCGKSKNKSSCESHADCGWQPSHVSGATCEVYATEFLCNQVIADCSWNPTAQACERRGTCVDRPKTGTSGTTKANKAASDTLEKKSEQAGSRREDERGTQQDTAGNDKKAKDQIDSDKKAKKMKTY